MASPEITQITAIGALFALTIRELFSYLKSRGDGKIDNSASILAELQLMNSNHLTTLQHSFDKLSASQEASHKQLIDTLHEDNMNMIEVLGEIKGTLNSRK